MKPFVTSVGFHLSIFVVKDLAFIYVVLAFLACFYVLFFTKNNTVLSPHL